uniref:Uncharacterized protein n=1 Tax=Anguilla anguilla TaxID=7936 RepID=A0A0E9PE20_ANGAN
MLFSCTLAERTSTHSAFSDKDTEGCHTSAVLSSKLLFNSIHFL